MSLLIYVSIRHSKAMGKVSSTTQKAPLERILSKLRSNRIGDIINNKSVLDFGCGTNAWTACVMSSRARFVHGVDASIPGITTLANGVELYNCLDQLPLSDYEVITAMAVFEHINPFELIDILKQLHELSSPSAIIFGTMPTPYARHILEFLSFKLRLINSSQIRDHFVYYDDLWFKHILSLTPWRLERYSKFQLGVNSQFILSKRHH